MFEFPGYTTHNLHPSVKINERVPSWSLAKLPDELEDKPYGAVKGFVDGHIRYRLDPSDNWQSPSATLTYRRGDCEDYAIAYYALLRLKGIEADQMAVIAGNQWRTWGGVRLGKISHAVLFVIRAEEETPLVFDNRRRNVHLAYDYYKHFSPVFWVNEKGGGFFLPDNQRENNDGDG